MLGNSQWARFLLCSSCDLSVHVRKAKGYHPISNFLLKLRFDTNFELFEREGLQSMRILGQAVVLFDDGLEPVQWLERGQNSGTYFQRFRSDCARVSFDFHVFIRSGSRVTPRTLCTHTRLTKWRQYYRQVKVPSNHQVLLGTPSYDKSEPKLYRIKRNAPHTLHAHTHTRSGGNASPLSPAVYRQEC